MLEHVLGQNDADIDHGADGNRDARQCHDVCIHPSELHGDEGDQHRQRQHGGDQ